MRLPGVNNAIHNLLKVVKEVSIWGPDGETKKEVKVDPIIFTPNDPKIVDKLLENVLELVNLKDKVTSEYSSSFEKLLPLVDSGGASACSIFSAGLAKIGKDVALFLFLERDEDPGTNTVFGYRVNCPKKIDETFKKELREIINNIVSRGSHILLERANLRKSFNESFRQQNYKNL